MDGRNSHRHGMDWRGTNGAQHVETLPHNRTDIHDSQPPPFGCRDVRHGRRGGRYDNDGHLISGELRRAKSFIPRTRRALLWTSPRPAVVSKDLHVRLWFDLIRRLAGLFVCNYVKWSPEHDVFCSPDGKRNRIARPKPTGARLLLFHNRVMDI